jgi:hypothetical protein
MGADSSSNPRGDIKTKLSRKQGRNKFSVPERSYGRKAAVRRARDYQASHGVRRIPEFPGEAVRSSDGHYSFSRGILHKAPPNFRSG